MRRVKTRNFNLKLKFSCLLSSLNRFRFRGTDIVKLGFTIYSLQEYLVYTPTDLQPRK